MLRRCIWQLFLSVPLPYSLPISYFIVTYSESRTFVFQCTPFQALLWGAPSLQSGTCICFLSASGGVCVSRACSLCLEECVCVSCFALQGLPTTSAAQAHTLQLLWVTGRQPNNKLVLRLVDQRGGNLLQQSRNPCVMHLSVISSCLPLVFSFSSPSFHCFNTLKQRTLLLSRLFLSVWTLSAKRLRSPRCPQDVGSSRQSVECLAAPIAHLPLCQTTLPAFLLCQLILWWFSKYLN